MRIAPRWDEAGHRRSTGSKCLGDVTKRAIYRDHHRLGRLGRNNTKPESEPEADNPCSRQTSAHGRESLRMVIIYSITVFLATMGCAKQEEAEAVPRESR